MSKCAVCGRKLEPEQSVFSRWTKNSYCVALDACKKRAKRGRASKKAAA